MLSVIWWYLDPGCQTTDEERRYKVYSHSPILCISTRCPLWLGAVTLQENLSAQMLHWYRLSLSCILCCVRGFHGHATLPLTNTAIPVSINNWPNFLREEQIPVVCNLYGGKTHSEYHVTSRFCTALWCKTDTACAALYRIMFWERIFCTELGIYL